MQSVRWKAMEVHLNPEKEAQFAQIAMQRGLRTDELAQQVLNRYVEADDHLIEAVSIGLAAAEGQGVLLLNL